MQKFQGNDFLLPESTYQGHNVDLEGLVRLLVLVPLGTRHDGAEVLTVGLFVFSPLHMGMMVKLYVK